jgi:hypothetical protein
MPLETVVDRFAGRRNRPVVKCSTGEQDWRVWAKPVITQCTVIVRVLLSLAETRAAASTERRPGCASLNRAISFSIRIIRQVTRVLGRQPQKI